MIRRLFHPESAIVLLLGLEQYRWYRKWIGGHWELWYVGESVGGDIWFHVTECSVVTETQPNGIALGLKACENHVTK